MNLSNLNPLSFAKCANKVILELDNVKKDIKAMREHNTKSFDEILEDYKEYAKEQAMKAEFFSTSLEYLGDIFPDMLWMKWTNGRYAFANKAIRDGLLFDDQPLEKDDIEMGGNAQKFFGANKHNFGSYCAGSDDLTIEAGHRMRFIEYGMSGGKPLVLEVYKNVVRDGNGKVIATVGCGRDITDNIFSMLKLEELSTKRGESLDVINEYLDRYLFENETITETLRDFYRNNKELYNAH